MDPDQNSLLVLMDQDETMVLPIGIGLSEAQAISLKLGGHVLPRPLTHDLAATICLSLGASIKKVVVNDFYEGTYYAQVFLERENKEFVVDSRPSDAIALSLTSGSPIFISEKVATQCLPFEEIIKENIENIFGDDDEFLH
ncbi:MAG: bifunctional nuclease family protein [Firmicutes bacterium]|nr:bifunctional nuclease family protein [Bacillota bacterium]